MGQGNGSVLLNSLQCYGNESNILKCPGALSQAMSPCHTSRDAGVICNQRPCKSMLALILLPYHVVSHDTAYPSNVMASATSNTTISVSWNIPTEFYSSITNYRLYRLHKTVNQLVICICIHVGWNVKATLLV